MAPSHAQEISTVSLLLSQTRKFRVPMISWPPCGFEFDQVLSDPYGSEPQVSTFLSRILVAQNAVDLRTITGMRKRTEIISSFLLSLSLPRCLNSLSQMSDHSAQETAKTGNSEKSEGFTYENERKKGSWT